jgi:F420-dependent oxidoreductase-like protein
MRFAVWPSPQRPFDETLDLVLHAEAAGWDGVYFADHFMPNAEDGSPAAGPTLEATAVLAALATRTERIRLGPLVFGNTYRHPAVVANWAAAVDRVSGGRLVLGLGAGWQVNEHRAYGITLPPVKELLDRFEEACQVVRALLGSDERVSFAGSHYQLDDAPCEPKPVQSVLPLLVGGGGERRTMRIAATYADEWNCWGTPELMRHKVQVLDRHCEDVGRDPADVRRSANAILLLSTDEAWLAEKRDSDLGRAAIVGTPAQVAEVVHEYDEAGIDELIIPDFTLGSLPRRKDTYDLFLTEVAAPFRG